MSKQTSKERLIMQGSHTDSSFISLLFTKLFALRLTITLNILHTNEHNVVLLLFFHNNVTVSDWVVSRRQ